MKIKAFTLVELIVIITIISILSWIWVVSYVSYLWDARDTQRKSDITLLSSALRTNKQQRWVYPVPWESFSLTYKSDSNVLVKQWKMDSNVILSNIDNLPLDPKTKLPYIYSVTNNNQEYQLAYTLENWDSPKAMVEWNYKSVSINVLPSIILAIKRAVWTNTDIQTVSNSFVLSDQSENLPYSIKTPFDPVSNSDSLSNLINQLKSDNLYWQNSDFRSCDQIKEAWKSLWTWENEYQIINSNWMLVNTNCSF